MKTKFKDIPGYGGLYSINSRGDVFSYRVGRIMIQALNPRNHYLQVHLRNRKCKRKAWRIHQLVLLTFVSKCPAGLEPDHINRIKTDNRLENLRYVSHSLDCHNSLRKKWKKFSPFRGVCLNWTRTTKPWCAVISRKGNQMWSRGISTARAAAIEYDRMAISIFGDSAITNKKLGRI
jgi:hypothetical protein